MKHTNIRNCLSRDQYSSRHFPPDQTLLASPGVIDTSLAGNPNILQHVLVLKIVMNSYPIFFAVNNREQVKFCSVYSDFYSILSYFIFNIFLISPICIICIICRGLGALRAPSPLQIQTQTQTQKHNPPNSDIKLPMYGPFKKCLILFFFNRDKYIIMHFLGIIGSGLDLFCSK